MKIVQNFDFMKDSDFFDRNVKFYDQDIIDFDYWMLNFLEKEYKNKQHFKLLDVGGGSGKFVKLVLKHFPNVACTVLDPSKKLLEKIHDPKIKKIEGKIPNDFKISSKYNIVHIKEVLHHITGNSVSESEKLIKESLNLIENSLTDDGLLMIHELFYEGFIFSKLPSYLIFYTLKTQNKFKINLPIEEFLLGLNVYFYTRNDLHKIISDCGFEIKYVYVEDFSNTWKKKLLLLKDWGRILIICKKSH